MIPAPPAPAPAPRALAQTLVTRGGWHLWPRPPHPPPPAPAPHRVTPPAPHVGVKLTPGDVGAPARHVRLGGAGAGGGTVYCVYLVHVPFACTMCV